MHVCFYVSFLFSMKFILGVVAKPVAIEDDWSISSTDYSPFSDDGIGSLGPESNIDPFALTSNLPDLAGVDSSCPVEVSLWEENGVILGLDDSNDLVLRDVDDGSSDTFFAGGKPATCVETKPGQEKDPTLEPEIPQLGFGALGVGGDVNCLDHPGHPIRACCLQSASRNQLVCAQCMC